jgi:hypothetical protein
MSSVPDNPSRPHVPRRGSGADAPAVSLSAFREAFGEELHCVLNQRTWRHGRDVVEEHRLLAEQVRQAVELETEQARAIRERIHPLLAAAPLAPPGAGRHAVSLAEVVKTQQGLLFNGGVEACDGTHHVHDSLALTVHQIGVSLVSYRGNADTWQQQLFRRDLRRAEAPEQSVLDLLEQRGRRGGLHEEQSDPLSELARRGLMSYMERVLLTRGSRAEWRMGHGSPAPLELICAYFTDLVIESIKVVRELIEYGRFVFVASEPNARALLTIGQGLRPLEYAIVGTLRHWIDRPLEEWRQRHPASVDLDWDGEELTPHQWVMRFRDEVAPKVVYGLYKASWLSPPQVFYAHADRAHVAARIAIADSVLLEKRGFPMLIDLADRVCNSVYGGGSLEAMTEAAYAAVDAPFRYGSERDTREP